MCRHLVPGFLILVLNDVRDKMEMLRTTQTLKLNSVSRASKSFHIVLGLLVIILTNGRVHGQVNLALNQLVNSSSVHVDSTKTYGPASKVVDGNKNSFLNGDSCLLTKQGATSVAWLYIDLGTVSVVQRIEMTNRKGGDETTSSAAKDRPHQEKLRGFVMAVSNLTSTIPPRPADVCYQDDGVFPPDVFQNRTCNQIGRYVLLQNNKSKELEICEVEVIGCPVGYYGHNCSMECSSCVVGQCFPGNGSCMFGCRPGFLGDMCTKECDGGHYGLNCAKTCGNCAQNQSCDHVTGGCHNGCADGYSGSKCTYANFAFGKPNFVSGIVDNTTFNGTAYMNKTVDTCYTSKRGASYVRLSVDLGQPAVINHIAIDITNSSTSKSVLRKRLNGLKVTVLRDEESNIGEVCYDDLDIESPDLNHLNWTCESVGRYVVFETDRRNLSQNDTDSKKYSKSAVLEFCEVKAIGCSFGTFGQNCELSCPNHCAYGSCFSNATCAIGCEAGYQGMQCDEKCEDGYFGEGCGRPCGHCLEYCNHVNGTCPSSCQPGWKGALCKTPCTPGYYGDNCTEVCGGCINGTICNHTNGVCHDGCTSGFKATATCKEECPDFTFGMNCSWTCGKCWNGTKCNKSTGECLNGCEPGWLKPYCVVACTPGYYGDNCTEACGGCINGTICNHTNGVCHDGCNSGFKATPTCKEACRPGYYGDNCTEVCGGCINGTICNHTNGVCHDGCTSGFKATPTCKEECPDFTFGMNCSRTCGKCWNGTKCEKSTGDCFYGCEPGWQEPYCLNACTPGYYGDNCTEVCGDCINDTICNHTNGVCHDGCTSGFKATATCKEECENFTYGMNCSQTCGKCWNWEICEKSTGECLYRCEPGWQEPYCLNECTNFTYGPDCSSVCGQCLHGHPCHPIDGNCSSGCEPGWQSPDCQTVCPDYYYGKNCVHQCGHCKNNDICTKANGSCTNGCAPGWQRPPKCMEECDAGYYGENCEKECGNCKPGSTCNRTDGTCLIMGCDDGWAGPRCDEESKPSSAVAAIGAGIGGFIIVFVIIGIVIFYVMRKRKVLELKKNKQNEHKEASEVVEMQSIDLPTFLSRRLQSNELEDEFKRLPAGETNACDVGKKPENKSRNRFLTTFPYDHSRVVLTGGGSDYVNACYIANCVKKDVYVATQGPKKNTLGDFWRMIWQINSDRIVMLANCVEMGKNKVEQYWPEKGQSRDFGEYSVVTTHIQTFAVFTVRTLSLCESSCETPKEIKQFHFTKWPDHGTPDIIHLLNFYKYVQSVETKLKGPMVVHCSAGIGRTGTFIAIDALVQYGTLKGKVAPFEYAKTMRENRMNMIQTKDQYIAVHQVLLEYFLCVDSTLTIEEFQDSSENFAQLKDEFTTLSQNRPTITMIESSDAMSEENISKNKHLEILPANRYRPLLMSQSPDRTNYINAVILPSCKTDTAFLVTQMPTADTLDEFWAMVLDYQSTAIVLLDRNEKVIPTPSCPKVTTTCFSVEYTPDNQDSDSYENVNIQRISVNRKGLPDSFITNSFEITNWPSDDNQSVSSIVKANYAVQSSQYSLKSPGPVTVVCGNGSDKCGVFCAVLNAAETLNMNRSANIFLTIRQLQYRRPSFIRFMHEYQTCYRAVAAHCETLCDYGNV
ncbi:uncharacterized protein [Argopecten irradians]|uniref:uncharacterized protein isoform X2 n=1 Tax=Argopecten irradians TaxID=31199 RepID=UPI00371A8881